MKSHLQRVLTDPRSRYYFFVSDTLAVVTVLSVLVVVLETVPSLQLYQDWFVVVEWIAVIIFSFEYVARLWVTKPARRYAFSVYGIIDLLAIVPTFVGLGNFTFLKTARALRLVRLLRMVRLLKLQSLQRHKEPEEQLGVVGLNILLLVVVLLVAVLLVGTLMYLVEGGTGSFASIPHSMLWSFKVFLVGLPIEYPETAWGQAGHIFARLVGLILFGVVVGVAGNILKAVVFGGGKR